MRVLILGATGGTGRRLVEQALEEGHTVTAVSRSVLEQAFPVERLRVVQADVRVGPAIEAIMDGHHAVVWAIGARPFEKARNVCFEGTRNVVQAMRRAGVRRFICESAFGVGNSRNGGLYATVLRILLRARVKDKERQESIIRDR